MIGSRSLAGRCGRSPWHCRVPRDDGPGAVWALHDWRVTYSSEQAEGRSSDSAKPSCGARRGTPRATWQQQPTCVTSRSNGEMCEWYTACTSWCEIQRARPEAVASKSSSIIDTSYMKRAGSPRGSVRETLTHPGASCGARMLTYSWRGTRIGICTARAQCSVDWCTDHGMPLVGRTTGTPREGHPVCGGPGACSFGPRRIRAAPTRAARPRRRFP